MKFFKLITLLFLLTSLKSISQTENPKFQFGITEGHLLFESRSVPYFTSTRAYFGYSLKKNWLVGLSPYYNVTPTEYFTFGGVYSLGFQAGLNLYSRKYFSEKNIKFFGEIGAGIGHTNTTEKLVSPNDGTAFATHTFTFSGFFLSG